MGHKIKINQKPAGDKRGSVLLGRCASPPAENRARVMLSASVNRLTPIEEKLPSLSIFRQKSNGDK